MRIVGGVVSAGVVGAPSRPIALALPSVNHTASSGPAAIEKGEAPTFGSENSVIEPSSATRPIRSVSGPVNHIAPSHPAVIAVGSDAVGRHRVRRDLAGRS